MENAREFSPNIMNNELSRSTESYDPQNFTNVYDTPGASYAYDPSTGVVIARFNGQERRSTTGLHAPNFALKVRSLLEELGAKSMNILKDVPLD